MAGVTGTSQIDNAVGKALAESRYTLQERPGVVKSIIRNETLPQGQGAALNIPKFGQVTTYALTEGVDMAQMQQITDLNMTVTPKEFGAQVFLTNMMLLETRDDFFRVAGRILAESYDRQQDETLCDDFDAYSKALGAAGTSLTIGHALAAEASIKYNAPANGTAGRGGEIGPGMVHVVHTPAALHSLKKTVIGHTAGAVVQASGGTASMGTAPDISRAGLSEEFTIGTIRFHSDININKDTSDDAKGGAFVSDAQVLVTLGDGPDIEREYDSSMRGWELNYVGIWARGEYDDDFGREMIFDSALPTS